jgi:hypothetical protein
MAPPEAVIPCKKTERQRRGSLIGPTLTSSNVRYRSGRSVSVGAITTEDEGTG